MIPISWWENKN